MDAQTPLEAALQRAVQDPASRPEFFRLLLDSEVFVCGIPNPAEEGQEQSLSLRVWHGADGNSRLPFFTRVDFLQQAIHEQNDAVSLPAGTLFEMTRGASLSLNPGQDYGKQFSPEEIAALLDGGVDVLASPIHLPPRSEVLLGQPAQLPDSMLDALRRFLPRHRSVRAAYLVLMHDPAIQEHPGLVIGLQVDGDFQAVFSEAGAVIADSAPAGITVDMLPVTPDDGGTSDYMLESVKPFYKRSWSQSLRNLLSPA
jgi:hypothetical protein